MDLEKNGAGWKNVATTSSCCRLRGILQAVFGRRKGEGGPVRMRMLNASEKLVAFENKIDGHM